MYASKKAPREVRFINPSFSSSLLDQIYRSIDEGERKTSTETKFYRDTTTGKKQSRSCMKRTENYNVVMTKKDRKSRYLRDGYNEQDVLFYSSTSISSDSSTGGFSSSDTESRASCFAPRPKHVRTSVSEKQGKRVFDGFCHNSSAEEALMKSKWRIYSDLKKMKQPISPGARLTSFLNSLFATGNAKKTRKTTYEEEANAERKVKSSAASTCSSRSCLSKTPSSVRLSKTVSFYPVNMILGEEKCLYEEEGSREFYRYNQKKNNGLVLNDLAIRTKMNHNEEENDDEDNDDAASYASSDLFELDHLAVFGSGRYCEELPVYDTTHVSTNRAIASGLIV